MTEPVKMLISIFVDPRHCIKYNKHTGLAPKKSLHYDRFSRQNKSKTPLSPLDRWERRYQKIGTVNWCMWRVVLLCECPKYNSVTGHISIRCILRPHPGLSSPQNGCFLYHFASIGSGDCDWPMEGSCSYQYSFLSVPASSTINPLTPPPKDPSVMVVATGCTRRNRVISSKKLGATIAEPRASESYQMKSCSFPLSPQAQLINRELLQNICPSSSLGLSNVEKTVKKRRFCRSGEVRLRQTGWAKLSVWMFVLLCNGIKYNWPTGGVFERCANHCRFSRRNSSKMPFSTIRVVKSDIRRLGQWMVSSKSVFFSTSASSTIDLLVAPDKEPSFLLIWALNRRKNGEKARVSPKWWSLFAADWMR